jgi:hypothetical protein
MKKSIVFVAATCFLALSIAGCGKTAEEPGTTTNESPVAASFEASDNTVPSSEVTESLSEEEPATTDNAEIGYPSLPLPEYHYYGPEEWVDYADSISQFLIENSFGKEESDLSICVPVILKVDESDPADVKAWGEFWVYTYQLINTSLIGGPGGSFGGLAHLDKTGGSPVLTDFEYVEDGSDYDPSVDRIFGSEGLKEAYVEACDKSEMYQNQALSYYINHNGLYITQYQHYGWPPVAIINAPPTKEEDQQIYYVGNAGFTTQFDMRQICALEMDNDETFSTVICDELNEALIEIYIDDGLDVEAAIKKIRKNLFDESAELTRIDDTSFNEISGCTVLMSEGPYKDGDHVYMNYIVPRDDHLFVIKIYSIYSENEEKQMYTDDVIAGLLNAMELK